MEGFKYINHVTFTRRRGVKTMEDKMNEEQEESSKTVDNGLDFGKGLEMDFGQFDFGLDF